VADSTLSNLDPERVAEARARAKAKLEHAAYLRDEANIKEFEAWRIRRTWGISDEEEV